MSFLIEQWNSFCVEFPEVKKAGELIDHVGIYAIKGVRDGKSFYFVAKNSMKGDLVSIHKALMEKCLNEHVGFVISIANKFYKFSPVEITSTLPGNKPAYFQNLFHGVIMVNFSIRFGKRIGKQMMQPENA